MKTKIQTYETYRAVSTPSLSENIAINGAAKYLKIAYNVQRQKKY